MHWAVSASHLNHTEATRWAGWLLVLFEEQQVSLESCMLRVCSSEMQVRFSCGPHPVSAKELVSAGCIRICPVEGVYSMDPHRLQHPQPLTGFCKNNSSQSHSSPPPLPFRTKLGPRTPLQPAVGPHSVAVNGADAASQGGWRRPEALSTGCFRKQQP